MENNKEEKKQEKQKSILPKGKCPLCGFYMDGNSLHSCRPKLK